MTIIKESAMRLSPQNQSDLFLLLYKISFIIIAVSLGFNLVMPMTVSADDNKVIVGPTSTQEVESFIDSFINSSSIKPYLAGAVVSIVRDKNILLNKGYGYSNLEKRILVDPNKTQFRVASISKTLTATAIMQLQDQDKLELDKDVNQYLGSLNIPNLTGKALTLKHLLTHTSGFNYTDSGVTVRSFNPNYSLENFIYKNMPTVTTDPGKAYRYDNYSYALQGYIVQKISGMPYENYIQRHIFDPLEMNNSYFLLTPNNLGDLATPYNKNNEPMPHYMVSSTISPDSGMITTGKDMSNFMIAMLNNGEYKNESILSPASVASMQKLDYSIHPDVPGVGYGFESTYNEYNNGRYIISKAGDLPGFHSDFWLLPKEGVGLFIVYNSDKIDLRGRLLEAFMQHYYPSSTTTAKGAQVSTTNRGLRAFTGYYRDLRQASWTYYITATEDELIVKDNYGVHKLTRIQDLLFMDDKGRQAAFKIDAQGDITYFYYNKSDSWAIKLPEPELYSDVSRDNPYGPSIYRLKQLGVLPQGNGRFAPEAAITGGEFLLQAMTVTGLYTATSNMSMTANQPYSKNTSINTTLMQTAQRLGIISNTNLRGFRLDQPITREQAATLLWQIVQSQKNIPSVTAKLAGKQSSWAMEGVSFVVLLRLYGPEVTIDLDGSINYQSQKLMSRQESAILLDKLINVLY
jgi:CubicO group peptidase (beta-lactamase class C family)